MTINRSAYLDKPYTLVNAETLVNPFTSDIIALPARSTTITWQTILAVAPGAVTFNLQGSLDGVHFSTIDSSTTVGGQIKTVETNLGFLRLTISALTIGGGTTFSIILNVKVD